ncbi:murein biosynthesis integral membrane protein MurJ, partial [bacterium]
IPNLLQNLFGEGALSASFIPVYARLRAEGEEDEAKRVAGAVAAILALVVSALVLLGVVATPVIIDLIAPGFEGEKRLAAIALVRIFFPGAGFLVMSAWCLGVLNSHRKFLLSYTAPVVWSAMIIAFLLIFGKREDGYRLAEYAAWGSVIGSFLQFAVQLPSVMALNGALKLGTGSGSTHVREVLKNFGPVAISRGVVQISAYVDQIIASFLPTGAIAAIGYAQVIYTLPVSLFGMAVSAAELPEMSSATGSIEEINAVVRRRLEAGLERIAFFVIPSAVAMLALGDMLAAMLFQHGKFSGDDAVYVWMVMAGYATGLLAVTMGRLYSSAFFALRDTKTPLRFALLRVAVSTALGYFCAIRLPSLFGVDPSWGTAGLAAAAGVAGWLEFILLRRGLGKIIGATALRASLAWKLWICAAIGAAIAWGVKLLLASINAAPF